MVVMSSMIDMAGLMLEGFLLLCVFYILAMIPIIAFKLAKGIMNSVDK